MMLHLIQPMARLWGRLSTSGRGSDTRAAIRLGLPVEHQVQLWSETWRPPEQILKAIESAIREDGGVVVCGGDYDRWDLELRGGSLANSRLYMTVEDHNGGRQRFRFRLVPHFTLIAVSTNLPATALAMGAALDRAWPATVILGSVASYLIVLAIVQCNFAHELLRRVLRRTGCVGEEQSIPSVNGEPVRMTSG